MDSKIDRSHGAITDVAGIAVGHFTSQERLTGCTVVLARQGAVGAVDVRGAAPGTRETDLLEPSNQVEKVQAILLAGGSAFGLDAATGVMRWLEERQLGHPTPFGVVPIVPAAVLYDLPMIREGDLANARPDASSGYAACEAASTAAPAQGNVGAGAGAMVGKLFGWHRAMKGGIGHSSVKVGPWIVGAIVACNAVGDVIDPRTDQIIAGARTEDGAGFVDTLAALLGGVQTRRQNAGTTATITNTTIGVVACNATLSKAQTKRLAMSAHDGLARTIKPVHTPFDGDTMFALATATRSEVADVFLLSVMAAQATELATINAVLAARRVSTVHGEILANEDLVHQGTVD